MDISNRIRDCRAALASINLADYGELARGAISRLSWYLAYGLVLFIIVFTAKFYGAQVDSLAREGLEKVDSVVVEFPYLEPQLFPPRVTVEYLRVYHRTTKKPLLLLKDTDVRLSVLPLLVGKLSVSITSRAYGGLVQADLSTGALFNTEWLNADVNLEMVELDKIPQVREYDKSLKGFVSLDASVSGSLLAPVDAEGEFVVSLAQLDMDNRFPVVKGARLKGFNVDMDCVMDDGTWSFKQFDVQNSDGISLKAGGLFRANAEVFSKSEIDMTGKFLGPPNLLATSVLDPKAVQMMNKKQAVPVKVSGPLENLSVTMK